MTKEDIKLARKKGYNYIFPSYISIQKWLRNKYKININIGHRTHSQMYYFYITGSYHIGESGLLYSEAALKKAVEEALKLI